MTITINLIYIMWILIGWIGCGLIGLPLFIILLKIDKSKIIFSTIDIVKIIALGPIGLAIGVHDLFKKIIDFIFGKNIWSLTHTIGHTSFDAEGSYTVKPSFQYYHGNLNVFDSRKKIIFESQYPEMHPSYFKLTYKKKRIK